jgi:hypothetical protein
MFPYRVSTQGGFLRTTSQTATESGQLPSDTSTLITTLKSNYRSQGAFKCRNISRVKYLYPNIKFRQQVRAERHNYYSDGF